MRQTRGFGDRSRRDRDEIELVRRALERHRSKTLVN